MMQITIDGNIYKTKEILINNGELAFINDSNGEYLNIKPRVDLVFVKDLGPHSVTNIETMNGNLSF